MAGVSWNSTSISSFFNTSLNLNTTGTNSIFSTLGDASLIKSGSYKKLMKSYFETVDTDSTSKKSSSSSSKSNSSSSSKSSSSSSSSTSTSKSRHACTYTYDCTRSTISTIRNTVLDDLLDKTEKKSTITNSVLDELLKQDDDTTTTEDGTVTDKTTTDTAVSGTASEAAAGAIIDESI